MFDPSGSDWLRGGSDWLRVLRVTLPLLSTPALAGLALALRTGDRRLIRGRTVRGRWPDEQGLGLDTPAEAGCLLGFCGLADGLTTCGQIENYFAERCREIDVALGERAGCRYLLNAWDDRSRAELAPAILEEIGAELLRRTEAPS